LPAKAPPPAYRGRRAQKGARIPELSLPDAGQVYEVARREVALVLSAEPPEDTLVLSDRCHAVTKAGEPLN